MDLDLAHYITRLRAELAGWAQVGDAADLAAIDDMPIVPPAVFLVLLSDAPSTPGALGDFTQRVVGRFGAVIVVSNLADTHGAAASSELVTRRRQVRDALAGWSPSHALGQSVRGPGSLLKFADGLLWWIDEYATEWYERT